jgi:hypothetical protein
MDLLDLFGSGQRSVVGYCETIMNPEAEKSLASWETKELLNVSFSMQSVPYKRKVGD